MRIALIDADSIAYIVGWQNRDHDDELLVRVAVNEFMVNLVTAVKASAYLGVFSPKKTFRNEISDLYKATRPPAHPGIAKWKDFIVQYCISEYGFIVADNIEADDVLSIIGNTKDYNEYILCHIDKDLRQIPGIHYDYRTKEWETITPDESEIIKWTQVLTGDTGDNVKGLKGCGKVCAAKALLDKPIDQLENIVLDTFVTKLGEEEGKRLFSEAVSLIQLTLPTPELVEMYRSKIQLVAFDDGEGLVESLLNHDTDDRFLQGDQRSHEGDVLCPPSNISE